MNKESHPLEEEQTEYRSANVKPSIDKLIEFSKTFLQKKTGLIGILLIFIVITIGITGNIIKDPPSTLYAGKTHYPKAPVWANIWSEKPVSDQKLISHTFEKSSSLNDERTFKIKRKVITDRNIIDAGYSVENNHLIFNFSGVTQTNTDSSTKSSPHALIVASSSFQWDYDNPPNDYNFNFNYKTLIRSRNKENISNNFTWSFTTYIKSKKVNDMKLFLNNVANLEIPNEIYSQEYGIQLTSSLPKSNTTIWRQKEAFLPPRIWTEVFESFSDFEINYVANFKWKEPVGKHQSHPNLSIHLDNIELIAKGYFGGIFGTSPTGHDLYGLIAVGVKNSLLLGAFTSSIMIFLGFTLGLISGFYRGKIDEITMRIADILLSIPNLPIMIVITMLFSRGGVGKIWGIVIVVAFMSWARPARFIRSQVLTEREKPYVETAKASGVPSLHIVFKHLFPNIIGVILYQVIISLQRVVLIIAGLSFLGLGPANWLSLGKIIQNSLVLLQEDITAFRLWFDSFFPGWWYVFFPGFILVVFLLGLLFAGITFQDMYQFSSRDY